MRTRILIFTLGVVLCGAISSQTKFSGKIKLNGKITWGTAPTGPVTKSNCTVNGGACTTITVVGDNDSGAANFSGKADPSKAVDPNTGTEFMCYSWLNTTNGTQIIETHLAKSLNNGATWSYVGTLYPSTSQLDVPSGNTVYSSNEVCKILAFNVGGTTWWFVAHLNYFKAPGIGTYTYTYRHAMSVAAGNSTTGPMAVVGAPTWYMGTNQNNQQTYYPTNYNFQTLSSGGVLSSCTSFRESIALIDPNDGKLVYLSQCGNLKFYAQFVTNTSPQAGAWTWTYVSGSNAFAVPADAVAACNYTAGAATCASYSNLAMTEADINLNNAGTQWGSSMTVANFNPGRYSTGCVWLEVDTSSRPYLFKRNAGAIIVDATMISSDSQSGGPGSCTYAPPGNLIMAHKTVAGNGGITTFFMTTGLLP